MHDNSRFRFLPAKLRGLHRAFSRDVQQEMLSQHQGQAPSLLTPRARPEPEEFAADAAAAAAECDRLLRTLSPRAAIAQWLDIDTATRATLTQTGFLGRARWVLAVAATGTSLDAGLVNEYFEQAARWWESARLADAYRPSLPGDRELALSVDAMPGRQFLTRTSSMTIRYHWACKKIATQIAREVGADREFAERLPEFTVGNVDRIFDMVRRHRDGAPPIAADDNKGMELVALMAVENGALSGLSFAGAARSHRMEMQPWVRFADGYLPCPPWQVLFALERPLLAAADTRLAATKKPKAKGTKGPDTKIEKGELFERVAHACIVDAIGHQCRQIPRGYDIKIEGTTKPRDVDSALIGETVQVLGEVKAYEAPDPDSAASGSFEEQIKEVYTQLHERLTALDSGIALIGHDSTLYHGTDAIGLGVVLHSYNTSLGDPRMLSYVTGAADTARIAVADLHSWVLLLHGLDGLEDLRGYLRFRQDLREIEALSVEECDMALPYFSPSRDRELNRLQQRYADRDRSAPVVALAQAWVVDNDIALDTKAPKNQRDWRRKFFRDCNPRPWSSILS